MLPRFFLPQLALAALVACATAEPVDQPPAGGGGGGAVGGAGGAGGTAGTGGAAGDAASDAPTDAPNDAVQGPCQCGDPGCGSCPTLKTLAAGGYGIFALEVTNQAYADFLATQPDPKLQTGVCAWNTSYTPSQDWPATDPNLPVVFVDYCDAFAYCHWAKFRLCGKKGGGANQYSDFADATKSQWYNACSVGGTRTYPYGVNYSGTACNGADYGKAAAIAAGEATGCEGGYPGLFDMSGNVWEWEDACASLSGASDLCRIRGGSYAQGSAALGCDSDSSLARNTAAKSLGFRCCE